MITKDSSLASIVRSTNNLSFESPGTDCKPSIHVHTVTCILQNVPEYRKELIYFNKGLILDMSAK